MQDSEIKSHRRRGIYLLPNLFTTAALFAGFYAVLASDQGRYEAAALAIFAAMILDGMDGRIARMTRTQSAFGAEYDSLSDMIAFGLAPALIMYDWSLHGLGKIGWLAAFIYTAGAALRLARFNTQIGTADKRYFQGLPSPSAAAILTSAIWIGADHQLDGQQFMWLAAFITATTGLLMVSNVRYLSFKELDMHGRVPFIVTVIIMLGFALAVLDPPIVLFILAVGYALSGPVLTVLHLRRRRSERQRDKKL